MCAFAHHGWRHDVPAEGLRRFPGGDFAQTESAIREVPERAFAVARLVDDHEVQVFVRDGSEESVVGTPAHQADVAAELAFTQCLQHARHAERRRLLARGFARHDQ